MLEVLRYIALNALNTVQKIKAMSKMSKIDKVHIRGVMLCMSKMSKMGKEHTHTFWLITSLILNGFSIRKKFWKALSLRKLRLRAFQPYHQILCMSKHVEDVEDGKRTYRHTFIIPFLIWYHLNVILCMSKIDQIHLRALMLCMSKMSKMGKEHTHLRHLRHASTYIGFDGMVGKLSVSTFTYPVLCLNYKVDCNSMSSNYSKIWFKPLIYFELKQSSN